MLPKEWRRLLGALAIVGAMMMVGCGSTTTSPDLGGGGNPDGTPAPAPAGVLALMQAAQRTATYVGNDRCASCHGQSGRQAPHMDFALFRESAHGQGRVACEQCHGPGSNHTTGPATDNIIGIPIVATELVCGSCHIERAAEYAESKHKNEVESPVADGGRAACVPCHDSAFRLVDVDLKLDAGEPVSAGLPQAEQAALVNATVSTVTCGNCHDPHQKRNNVSSDGHDHQLRRKHGNTDLSEVGEPGQPRSTIVSYDHACAQCHMGGSGSTASAEDAALLAESSRPNVHDNPQFYMLMGLGGVEDPADADDDLVTHSNIPDQCIKCHMPDNNHKMEVELDVSCSPCHSALDATALLTNRQAATQAAMDALVVRLEAWAQATFGNPDHWEYSSNLPTGTAPPANQIPIEVRRARHNLYLIIRDLSGGVHNGAYANELLAVANTNLTALGVAP